MMLNLVVFVKELAENDVEIPIYEDASNTGVTISQGSDSHADSSSQTAVHNSELSDSSTLSQLAISEV